MRNRRLRCHRGLSLVEMVVSIMLVGVMLVAALGTVGLTQRTRYLAAERRQASHLADALLSEILEQAYADAAQMPTLQADVLGLGITVAVTIGAEVGEIDSTRAGFDDIDDYHGWTASPPQEKGGTVLSNLSGWTRSVQVDLVEHDKVTVDSAEDDGVKRITVTVQYLGETLAEMVALRSLQLPDTQACCLPDGSTLDMEPDVCLNYGGVSGGTGSTSLNTTCETPVGPAVATYESFTEAKYPGSTSSATIVKPEGTEEGDLLIAAIAIHQSNGYLLPPVGWTVVDDRYENSVRLAVLMHVAGPLEDSDYTFNFAGGTSAYAWMMRFSGTDTANPIHQQAGLAGKKAWSPPVPSVTTTLDNCLILRLGAFRSYEVTVDETGLGGHETITMDFSGYSNACSGGAGWMMLPTAGGSGTATFSLDWKNNYVTLTLAIASEPQ